MNNFPTFGTLLNQYLSERDRSPAWLARRLGVSGATVSRWLNNGARPGSPETVVRIADVLGHSAERATLLVAAGYGYQEAGQATPAHSAATQSPLMTLPTKQPPPKNGVAASSLVGRKQEWQALVQLWEEIQRGSSRLVSVVGEPGIGKSRLVQELLSHVQAQGFATAYARTYATEGRLIYDPVATWLRAPMVEQRRQGLADIWLIELVRLLPELLVDHLHWPEPQPVLERWQRRRFFEALARAFVTVSEPLLLVLDDIQWCDHETLEWLHYLVRFNPQAALLVVVTIRPSEIDSDHPFHAMRRNLQRDGMMIEMELGPLDMAETTQMVQRLIGRVPDASQQTTFYQVTAGNPLFIEELARAGLEHETLQAFPSARLRLPSRVQAVIEARLANLSPSAYTLATWLAVAGRACTPAFLARASGENDDNLLHALEELWQRRIVSVQEQSTYDFSHDLIREVAYSTLNPVRKSFLHRRFAQTLVEIHATALDQVSSQIAEHYEHAGLPLQALPYYERAAARAQQIFAHDDAIRFLNRCLSMLDAQEDSDERKRLELRLLLVLSVSWAVLKGRAAPELLTTLERAEALSLQVGDDLQHLLVLQRKALALLVQNRMEEAYLVSQERMPLVRRLSDPIYLVEATLQLGVLSQDLGYLRRSQAHFESMLAQTEYQWPHATSILDQHPIVAARRNLAITLWYLGYPERAQHEMEGAWADAKASNHPFTQVGAAVWGALLALYLRDVERTQQCAETAIALASEWGFDSWLGHGQFFLGWALAHQERVDEGVALMHSVIGAQSAHGSRLHPQRLLYLATAYGQAGQIERGLLLLDQALSELIRGGRHLCLAEVYQMRGTLLQGQGADAAIVEASFLEALEIAGQQEAKSLELRAAMSISRLWSEQGKSQEAYSLLAESYGWFTEGFDTLDLQEARMLLAQL